MIFKSTSPNINQMSGATFGSNNSFTAAPKLQVTAAPQTTAKLQVTAQPQTTYNPQAQRTTAPAQPTSSQTLLQNSPSSIYSGGGTSAPAAYVPDPSELAYWDDQIASGNESLGRLDRTLGVANSNIDAAEREALATAGTQYGKAERDFGTNKQYQIDDQVVTNNNIDTYVRTSNNALQRLFAGAGSGMSSASQIMAPYATARDGTVKRDGADTMYKRNMGKLDTAWQDTTDNYNTTVGSIKKQASDKKQTAKMTYEENRASLLDLIGGATLQKSQAGGSNYLTARAAMQPFQAQASQARDAAVGYGNLWSQPVALNAGNVAFNKPTLDSYNLQREAVQAPTAMEQLISPNYYPILNDEEKKQ